MKTLVLGLDGANWNLIDRWIEKGELPNIKKLKEKGCWGILESHLPPVTVPNWKCYSSGKNPGKFGVFWFEIVDINKKKIEIPNSKSYRTRELWDFLTDEGKKVGIINMPTTYPPKKINGYLIAGGPETTYGVDESVTYPRNFEKKIKEKGYKIHPENPIISKKKSEKSVEEILSLIDSRFDMLDYFLEKKGLDFIHVTIFYLNVLQHFFWDEEPTKRAWKIIDKRIGNLVDKNYNIFLMSDHGCNKISYEFFINTWLEREGFLKTKSSISDVIGKMGLNKENLIEKTKKIGILKIIHKNIPEKLVNLLPTNEGVVFKAKTSKINWDKTDAMSSGQGIIYINSEKGSKKYENIRNSLTEKISNLKLPNGKKVVKKIYFPEEIYKGKYLKNTPDIIFEQSDRVHTNGSIGNEKIFSKPRKWKAENIKKGIFLAYGNNIKRSYKKININIVDLAPTILHYMKCKVPEDMDGRVLKEIFKKSSEPYKRRVKYRKKEKKGKKEKTLSKKEQEEVRKRLEDLGYL